MQQRLFKTIILLILFLLSCQKEEFITTSDAKLSFSQDTVFFDTVFTSIGSSTRTLMVYNNNSKSVRISSIKLTNSANSLFKINIDANGSSASDVEIKPKDSLYIFVQVKIDPNNLNTPLEVLDSITFELNGNSQYAKLQAIGQNVNFIRDSVINTQTWTNAKPYLIYESMLVDSAHTLTIEAGTKLYFHRNSRLFVKGSLIVNGELSKPVIFRGDRLDEVYSKTSFDKLPGQWEGIFFMSNTKDNKISHAEIRNSVIGIQLGVLGQTDQPRLEIDNSKIENHTYAGIFAIQSEIKANNVLIANCGTFTFIANTGGNYEFYHCTFANYYKHATRKLPSVLLLNTSEFNKVVYKGDLNQAYFANCIITGSLESELGIEIYSGIKQNYKFENCYLRIKTDVVDISDNTKFKKNIIYQQTDSLFVKIDSENLIYNFELNTKSPAKDKGNSDIAKIYPQDYYNRSRIDDNGPDLGAFEYVKK